MISIYRWIGSLLTLTACATGLANDRKNLAAEATVSTPHAAERTTRTSIKAVDGTGGRNLNAGWQPASTRVKEGKPVLLALSWPEAVTIEEVSLHWPTGQASSFADYTLAVWQGDGPLPALEAPAPTLPVQDVFVSGEGGYYMFRIPALVVSSRGTVFAFSEGRKDSAHDFGAIDLVLKRSFDAGRSWTPVERVHGEPGKVTMGNAVPIADRTTGDVHVVFCRDARRLLYTRTGDEGSTFIEPVDITSVVDELFAPLGIKWSTVFTGPGRGWQMRSGRLVVPIKPVGAPEEGPKRRVGVIYSDDHGKTWRPGGLVPPAIGEISEASVVETADGALLMNIRWHDGSYRVVTRSFDGGLTWTEGVAEHALPDPGCQASLVRYSRDPADMRLLISNLDEQRREFHARRRLTVRLSHDDGLTWSSSKLVVPGPSGYSDMDVLPDGRVLLIFERGTEVYSERLSLATFHPDSITEVPQPERPAPGLDEDETVRAMTEHPSWTPIFPVRANTEPEKRTHRLSSPVTTRALFLLVEGSRRPDGSVNLQEIEVFGRRP